MTQPNNNSSTSGYKAPTYGTGSNYQSCSYVHDGRDIVIEDEARHIIIGGAKASTIPWEEPDLRLIIDCSDGVTVPSDFVKSAPEKFLDKISGHSMAPPGIIKLKWTDMAAPSALPKFWQALWDVLPEGLVVISCMGSHGRTGTALACLMVVNGMTPEASIKAVRDLHCPKAVESVAQEKYIHYVYNSLWKNADPKAVRVKVAANYEEPKETPKLVTATASAPVNNGGTTWKPVQLDEEYYGH